MNSDNKLAPSSASSDRTMEQMQIENTRLQSELGSIKSALNSVHAEIYSMLSPLWIFILVVFSRLTRSSKSWSDIFLILIILGMAIACAHRSAQLFRSGSKRPQD
jgi:hypothetical protein